MVICSSCGRHVLSLSPICPFCAASSLPGKIVAAAGALVTPIVLSACYGAPPCDTADLVDADGDGFQVCTSYGYVPGPEDCDDAVATVNPDATEVCDDTIDNDCDYNADAADADCATTDTDTDTSADTDTH